MSKPDYKLKAKIIREYKNLDFSFFYTTKRVCAFPLPVVRNSKEKKYKEICCYELP